MSNYLHAIADAFTAIGARVVFREEGDERVFAENVYTIRQQAHSVDADGRPKAAKFGTLVSPGDPTPSAAETSVSDSANSGVGEDSTAVSSPTPGMGAPTE